MADRIQLRRDTKANWETYNPILLEGEPGHVLDDPNLYKMGDGVHAWNDLPYRGYAGTIVQTTGNAENAVMSQKAVTDRLKNISSAITIIPNPYGIPNIDTTNLILDLKNCILCIKGNYWEMSTIWPNNPEYYRQIPLRGDIVTSATKIVFNTSTKRFYPKIFSSALDEDEVLIGGVRTNYGTRQFVNAEFPFDYTIDDEDVRYSSTERIYPYAFYTGNDNNFVWGNKIQGVVPGEKYDINILTPDIDMSGVTITGSVMRLSVLFTRKDGTTVDQSIVPLYTDGQITPLKSKYTITIPENTIYFQVGGRCTNGKEFKTVIGVSVSSIENEISNLESDVNALESDVNALENTLSQAIISKFNFGPGEHSSLLNSVSHQFKGGDEVKIVFDISNTSSVVGLQVWFRNGSTDVYHFSFSGVQNNKLYAFTIPSDCNNFGYYFTTSANILFKASLWVNRGFEAVDNLLKGIEEERIYTYMDGSLYFKQNAHPYAFYTGNDNNFVWGNKIRGAIPGEKYDINILTPDIDMSGVTTTDSVMRLSVLFTRKDGTTIDQGIVGLRTDGQITPLKSKYTITIPENTIYFQVGGRCTNGKEFKTVITRSTGEIQNYENAYFGQPIKIASNKYGRPLFKALSPSYWHQSMAIYNDYAVFMIYGYGTDGTIQEGKLTMHIYSISSGSKLASIDVPYGNYTIPHCNTSVFGKEFASENSIAPLLYVSQWNGERNCLVYDITYDSDVYSVELKQIIGTSGINQDVEGIGMRDWVVDTDNNVMYSIAYYLNSDSQVDGNKTMFMKFPLPSLSAGNTVFNTQDIIDHFELEFFKFFQDKCYNAGKIYIASGMHNFQSITNLRVLDLNAKSIVTLIPLGDTYNSEPEGLDIYKDKLLMTYGSMSLYSIETE